jgi:hypothetical protein
MAFRLFCWSLSMALVLTANAISYRSGVDWNVGGLFSFIAGSLVGLVIGTSPWAIRAVGQ